MSGLRLVNPQKMETLPSEGRVFLDYTADGERLTASVSVDVIAYFAPKKAHTFHAWSYTATFEEGEGNGSE